MEALSLGVMIAAAAAAETAVTGAPEVAGGGWISGDTLTTILTILCGAGGVVGGKMWGDRNAKKHEDEIRTQIANELRAKIVNDPLHVQKVPDCISVQECNRKMDALGSRVTELEKKVDAKFDKISEQLNAMDDKSEARSVALHRRLDKLFERIVK